MYTGCLDDLRFFYILLKRYVFLCGPSNGAMGQSTMESSA